SAAGRVPAAIQPAAAASGAGYATPGPAVSHQSSSLPRTTAALGVPFWFHGGAAEHARLPGLWRKPLVCMRVAPRKTGSLAEIRGAYSGKLPPPLHSRAALK